jgi:hypothetical protein
MSSPTDEINELPTAELGTGTAGITQFQSDVQTEEPFLIGRMEEIGKGGDSIVYKVKSWPNKISTDADGRSR